ncbi:MAG: MFS transporter [Ahrensia sp.]|nr:MFS transporter [Ahrensia sp.]
MFAQLRPVSSLLVSSLFLFIGGGLTGILLPLRAGLEGWSPLTIGLMGSFYAAAFLAGCFLMPKLIRRIGHIRVIAVTATLISMSVLAHSVFVNIPAWFLFRGIAGFALAGAYTVLESWFNEEATNESRGTVFSAYMLSNSIGLMMGQFLLVTADPALTTLFIFSAIAYGAAVLPISVMVSSSPQPPTETKIDLKKLFNTSPVATVGAFITGITFGAWNIHTPVYGSLIGLSDAAIASLLMATMLGGMIFQFPLGRISDKIDRRYVMLFATCAGLTASIFFTFLEPRSTVVLFGLMFVFGAVLLPLYSLAVAHANDHAAEGEFVETSSGLLIVYAVGTMVGPFVAGFLDGYGRQSRLVYYNDHRLCVSGAVHRIPNYADRCSAKRTAQQFCLHADWSKPNA